MKSSFSWNKQTNKQKEISSWKQADCLGLEPAWGLPGKLVGQPSKARRGLSCAPAVSSVARTGVPLAFLWRWARWRKPPPSPLAVLFASSAGASENRPGCAVSSGLPAAPASLLPSHRSPDAPSSPKPARQRLRSRLPRALFSPFFLSDPLWCDAAATAAAAAAERRFLTRPSAPELPVDAFFFFFFLGGEVETFLAGIF